MDAAIDLHIAELLCSRLCHDVVSPVGAIKSGLELIEEFGEEPDDEAASLIRKSAELALARLQVFRSAYGFAGTGKTPLSMGAAAELAAIAIETPRTKLVWPTESKLDNPRLAAGGLKVLLNMLLLGAEALPRGGHLRVTVVPHSQSLQVQVTADAEDARLDDALQDAFDGRCAVEDLTSRTVQGYFTALVGQRLRCPVQLSQRPFVLSCTLPAVVDGAVLNAI